MLLEYTQFFTTIFLIIQLHCCAIGCNSLTNRELSQVTLLVLAEKYGVSKFELYCLFCVFSSLLLCILLPSRNNKIILMSSCPPLLLIMSHLYPSLTLLETPIYQPPPVVYYCWVYLLSSNHPESVAA